LTTPRHGIQIKVARRYFALGTAALSMPRLKGKAQRAEHGQSRCAVAMGLISIAQITVSHDNWQTLHRL
jgi:hypothetical protein